MGGRFRGEFRLSLCHDFSVQRTVSCRAAPGVGVFAALQKELRSIALRAFLRRCAEIHSQKLYIIPADH